MDMMTGAFRPSVCSVWTEQQVGRGRAEVAEGGHGMEGLEGVEGMNTFMRSFASLVSGCCWGSIDGHQRMHAVIDPALRRLTSMTLARVASPARQKAKPGVTTGITLWPVFGVVVWPTQQLVACVTARRLNPSAASRATISVKYMWATRFYHDIIVVTPGALICCDSTDCAGQVSPRRLMT